MLLIWIALWTIAAVLIFSNKESESARWASLTAFLGGFGGLAEFIRSDILPYLQHYLIFGYDVSWICQLLIGFFLTLSHYLTPYAFLVFSLSISGFLGMRWDQCRKHLKLLFVLPALFMFILYPPAPAFDPNQVVLTIWVVPFILSSNFFVLYAYFQSKNLRFKQQMLFTFIIYGIPTLYSMFSSYILVCMGIPDMWKYNTWFIYSIFLIFVILVVRYGVFGARLRLEKSTLDSNMKIIDSGTTLMNHTLKNQLLKISMSANNTKLYHPPTQEKIDQNMDIILESVDHMFHMVNKIREQVQPIHITKTTEHLESIIEQSIEAVKIYLEQKNIQWSIKNVQIPLECDKIHLKEVLINVLMNAVEALDTNGLIYISGHKKRKYFTLIIQDNGKGISEDNFPHVIKPFFTTKKHGSNYGLGLAYCYNVMQCHGGTLEIESEENKGTTLFLNFPIKKTSKNTYSIKKDVANHG